MLGELVSLYYTTFLVSVRSLNVSGDIYSMEELLIEIEDHIMYGLYQSIKGQFRQTLMLSYFRYGFLEGIWYLDILHHGHVPKANSPSLYAFG